MFGDGSLTFREFMVREPLPLATVHDAVLLFLAGRDDAVLCGAQAVNAYVHNPRMTEDVDIVSDRALELVEEVKSFLMREFDIHVQSRLGRNGICYQVFQERGPKPRRLIDVYSVEELPPHKTIHEVRVLIPAELICAKVIRMARRKKTPKSYLDLADTQRLLLAFPKLKTAAGPVAKCLRAAAASADVMAAWKELVAQEILPEDEDEGF